VRSERGALSRWLVGHLPVTMTIAATGGVMVSMVEHSSGGHAPAPAAMVLSLSVSVGVLALVLVATSLADFRDLAPVYRPVSVALGVAAVLAVLLGWLAPPPWLQILLLTLVLAAVWLYGILTWFSFTHHDGASPAEARPRLGLMRRPWWSRRGRPPEGSAPGPS
jgi:low temperature requirement protein LtrA